MGDDSLSRRRGGCSGSGGAGLAAVSAAQGLSPLDCGRRRGPGSFLHHGDRAAGEASQGELTVPARSNDDLWRVVKMLPQRGDTALCDNIYESSAPAQRGARRMKQWAIYFSRGTWWCLAWLHSCYSVPSGCRSWARGWVKV